MAELFSTLDVARSGLGVYKTWLNAIADNVANIDNVSATDQPAFRERFVLVESVEGDGGFGEGARIAGARFGDPNGWLHYEPDHPLADEQGMVRRPAVDLGDQMVYMQLAQRGYQANLQTFERAREAYESALSIGR